MSGELDRLKTLLGELFQLDAAEDLDFGMYRVLRLRRDALTTFLERTLVEEVQRTLGSRAGDGSALRDGSDSERQVYAHLAEFFSRYYEDGDFIALPRVRRDSYAIPYDGREVVLYWANKDQLYVKSGEYFVRYAFELADRRRVVFRLVDAETDPDNMKNTDTGKRRFRLVDGDGAVKVEDGALICQFVYRPTEGRQDTVNAETAERILETAPREWAHALRADAPRSSTTCSTLLAWHLRQYTEKNRRDYFIHKDLNSFLWRELDQYLKTEVFDLDAIEGMCPNDVTRTLEMVRAIRAVAKPIITFLASLENFQRRLFLKRKMVLRTEWCVTLDRVPEALYPEIEANEEQWQRWRELYAIDEVDTAKLLLERQDGRRCSFLASDPGLIVETRFFNDDFKASLLAQLGPDVDTKVTGVLIRGENLAACSMLLPCFGQSITHAFIDPPYNTGEDGFVYKDRYRHSSWLAMMRDRLFLLRELLGPTGIVGVTIDFVESANLRLGMDQIFGSAAFVADVAWSKRYTRSNNAKKFYSLKDSLMVYARSGAVGMVKEARTQKSREGYTNPDNDPRGPWLSSSYVNPATKAERPNLVYEIRNPYTGRMVSHKTHAWKYEPTTHQQHVADGRLYWGEAGDYEYPRLKSFLVDAKDEMVPVDVWDYKYAGSTDEGGNVLKDMFGGAIFSNPKPTQLVERFLELRVDEQRCRCAIDTFAGSGTTGHAVINLNRDDQGNRKFILVEVNDYFDTVLVPRILKATYSKEWKDKKPVDRTPVPGGALYKILYLESYEDTLANISLPPPSDNPLPLRFHREYTVRYMIEREAQQAVMNLDRFRRPFSWTMEVRRGGLVIPDHPVDLVETFNYLIGLHVRRYGYFKAPNRIRYVEGVVREDGNDRRVLVLWRDCELVSDDELVKMFNDREFAPVSSREYDRIYVNGDPPLANVRRQEEQWKVLAIEDEFKRLCFIDADLEA